MFSRLLSPQLSFSLSAYIAVFLSLCHALSLSVALSLSLSSKETAVSCFSAWLETLRSSASRCSHDGEMEKEEEVCVCVGGWGGLRGSGVEDLCFPSSLRRRNAIAHTRSLYLGVEILMYRIMECV